MAIEPKISDLINAEIDGTISAEDQTLLDQYLAENGEARTFRDELKSLCEELQSLPQVDPPAGLLQHAMKKATADNARTATAPAGRSWQLVLGEIFGFTPLRYAVSFAAGVIVTFTLVNSDQVSRGAFDEVTGLVGTMSDQGSAGKSLLVDAMALTLNELAGSVTLNRAGSIVILDFDLASRSPVEIVARFDNHDTWFNGFAQLESAGTSVAAGTGSVTIRMEGQRRYAVYLHHTGRSAATVNLQFFSAGKLLHEGEIGIRETR